VRCWPVQNAKARFSALLETCLKEGPQMVTRRGADVAVLVPLSEWERLQAAARPTLKELLLTAAPRGNLHIPARGRLSRRKPGDPE
jgi:antitoxin Phd